MIWSLVTTVVVCFAIFEAMWIAVVWLVGAVSQAIQSRQEATVRQQREAEAASHRAQAEVIASLKPEDVDWLKANGWQATAKTAEPAG